MGRDVVALLRKAKISIPAASSGKFKFKNVLCFAKDIIQLAV